MAANIARAPKLITDFNRATPNQPPDLERAIKKFERSKNNNKVTELCLTLFKTIIPEMISSEQARLNDLNNDFLKPDIKWPQLRKAYHEKEGRRDVITRTTRLADELLALVPRAEKADIESTFGSIDALTENLNKMQTKLVKTATDKASELGQNLQLPPTKKKESICSPLYITKKLINLSTLIPRIYLRQLWNHPGRTLIATGVVLGAGAKIASTSYVQTLAKSTVQNLANHESLKQITTTIGKFAESALKPEFIRSIQEPILNTANAAKQNISQFLLPAVEAAGAGIAALGAAVKFRASIPVAAKKLLNIGTFIPRLYANQLWNHPERTLIATGAVIAAGVGIATNESIQDVVKPLAEQLATHESLYSFKSTIQTLANKILSPELVTSIQETASSVATSGIQNLNGVILPAVGAVGAGLVAIGLNWKHPFFTSAAVVVGSAFTGFAPGMVIGAGTMAVSAFARKW